MACCVMAKTKIVLQNLPMSLPFVNHYFESIKK